jgi:hypothetical protein
MPGFWIPMAFNIPVPDEPIRGAGLPGHGTGDTDLATAAP